MLGGQETPSSCLETGRGVPKQRDVRDLLRLYGVQQEEVVYEELLELASEGAEPGLVERLQGHSARTDFPSTSAATDRPRAGRNDAPELRRLLHPRGHPQTEDYADGFDPDLLPGRSPQERARMVQLRMERQKVLNRDPDRLDLRVIIDESALMRPIGGGDIMRDQLHGATRHDRVPRRMS